MAQAENSIVQRINACSSRYSMLLMTDIIFLLLLGNVSRLLCKDDVSRTGLLYKHNVLLIEVAPCVWEKIDANLIFMCSQCEALIV